MNRAQMMSDIEALIELHYKKQSKDQASLLLAVSNMLTRVRALEQKAQISSNTTKAEQQIIESAHELSKPQPEKKTEEPK